jgi:protein SCO1/2
MDWKRIVGSAAFLIALCNLSSSALAAKSYAARGIVLKVDQPHRSLVVSCDAIPGYMAAMAMPFTVRDAKELEGLTAGAAIEFNLVVDQTSSRIEEIRARPYENTEQDPLSARRLKLVAGFAGPPPAPEVQTGDRVPDFTLIDQNRQRVSLSQFKGQVVAVTFIYTNCALPDFCYRLSTNFSRLQKRFTGRMGRDLILLTITFDPAHDTPEVLKKYGAIWNADAKGWRLLSGPKPDVDKVCGMFGISFWPDEGLMTHSLHTLLIDRNGVLTANLEGNKFTADQLSDLVQTVIDRPRTKVR